MKYIACVLISIVFILGCNTTEPEDNKIPSHNIEWRMFTFGDHSSSSLNDVAIIDENNIWAVGEIFLKDSLGQIDYEPYGFAHWDGTKWSVIKIKTLSTRGDSISLIPQAILAFSNNNIWFVSGGVHHFNGKKITKSYWINYGPDAIFDWYNQQLHEITGTSGDNLYVAGDNGALAHFDGTKWTKIETNTDLNIDDMQYNKRYPRNIIAVAGKDYENFNKEFLHITGLNVKKIKINSGEQFIRSLWFDDDYRTVLVGTSIYASTHILYDSTMKEIQFERIKYALNSIRGNSINDLFIAGAYGEILHYNGATWKSYIDQTNIDGNYLKIEVKSNLVISVGRAGPFAKIAHGLRK